MEFYSKNKFEKLVLLVGFIIRIYHDAGPLNIKMKTQFSTPTSTLSFRLKNIKNTNKISRVMYCFILYLPKVPFFHGWRALLRLGFLILDAL